MSDVSYTLQLPEARLDSIDRDDNAITLRFAQVFLIQNMEGAFEDSLWNQAVNLTISDYNLEGELPACPCELSGGDMIDNFYTYRDHAPLPIKWRGEVGCTLRVAGSDVPFSITGSGMRLEQIDTPRYIRHIKK